MKSVTAIVLSAIFLSACEPVPVEKPLTAEEVKQKIVQEKIENARQSNPDLNWISIGVSTGKYYEQLTTKVHKTYAECAAETTEEVNNCIPISALPDSYWSAEAK